MAATTLAQVQAAGGLAAMTMAGQGGPAVSLSNLSDPRLQVQSTVYFLRCTSALLILFARPF